MNEVHSQGEESWRAIAIWWGVVSPASKGPRPRFSLQEVVAAGVVLADRVGLSGLTLAAVADELGLTTTALYRYVDSKETLIELMVDAAAGPPPPLRGPWPAKVRSWTSALWEVFVRHPWLCDVKPSGPPRCPNGLAWYDQLLGALAAIPVATPAEIALELNVLIRSYAALHASIAAEPPPSPDWFADVVSRRHPHVVAYGQAASMVDSFWAAYERLIASLPVAGGQPFERKK